MRQKTIRTEGEVILILELCMGLQGNLAKVDLVIGAGRDCDHELLGCEPSFIAVLGQAQPVGQSITNRAQLKAVTEFLRRGIVSYRFHFVFLQFGELGPSQDAQSSCILHEEAIGRQHEGGFHLEWVQGGEFLLLKSLVGEACVEAQVQVPPHGLKANVDHRKNAILKLHTFRIECDFGLPGHLSNEDGQ